MLQRLQIENYALIDHLDLEFHPGLNLLTGETGSGKSIVVEAVGLLLGEKASAEVIRSGAERARIAGVFSAPPSSSRSQSGRWGQLLELLAEAGIEVAEGDEVVLQREILPGGKSRIFLNHQLATVGFSRTLAPYLAEVHGQNEQQELFSPSAQLQMLDRFGGLAERAAEVRERFELWKELRAQQEELARRRQEQLRQMDLWHFQKREIEQAGIAPGEDQRLEEEKLLLTHASRIQSRLASCYELLYDSPHAALSSLALALKGLEEVSVYDAALRPLIEALVSAKVSMEDAALAVRDRLSRLDASPGRLEEVENRLALLDRLKKKYGPALEEVVRYLQEVNEQLEAAESDEAAGQAIEGQVREAATAYEKAAQELSRRRAQAAKDLKRAVEKELRDLAMKGTVFEARLESSAAPEAWRASGMDQMEFLISPNPGEPLRALARIASGGEISRIMLALETVTDAHPSSGDARPTLIFDEVDAGIGGRAAEMVGRKLRQLGQHHQVLCVTHLPQIASFAHHHFRVEKVEQKGRTLTKVHYLEEQDRVAELARMLSGSRISDAVLKHAAQLLKMNS